MVAIDIKEVGPKILNGGLAGIVGVTCVFPIDLVKTRLQNQRIVDGKAQYTGIKDCATQTWRAAGGGLRALPAMYSGSGVNILLITPEKAIKLVANDVFRQLLIKEGEKKLSFGRGMIAGGLAGACQIVVTTPMELLKIQMQQGTGNVAGQPKMTAWQLTKNIVNTSGFRGLYKGLSSTLARDVTFSVLYFPGFAFLESLGPRKSPGSDTPAFISTLMGGGVAGASACFAVTPLDVIKTRMQTLGPSGVQYKNVADAAVTILRTEGPQALFKGALCRMMVIAPLFAIAQTVYYLGVAESLLGMKQAERH